MPITLGKGLVLPDDAVTQTLVVYGGKGMGKTVFGAVLAEELAKARKRFSVIDPVGRSWGLRWGADGKSDGLKILILGGRHGDMPIHPHGGAAIADLVVNEDVDTLIDISSYADGKGWTHGEKLRFVGDYCNRLYEEGQRRRRPMMQIIDEAGRFAMQQIPHGAVDAAKCLGAVEQLVELGRNAGIGVCLITQRSARMAKSVSELASAMVAFRTVGPNSVTAILDWFGEHVEKAKWKELLEQLRSLPRGTALVVSPGWLELEAAFPIRMRHTYDSSATPKGGGEHRVQGGRTPDLAKYQKLLASVVAEAQANDPKHLRANLSRAQSMIAELERQVAKANQAPPKPGKPEKVEKIVEKVTKVPSLTDKQLETLLGRIDAAIDAAKDRILTPLGELRDQVLQAQKAGMLALEKTAVAAVTNFTAEKMHRSPLTPPVRPIAPLHKAPDKPTKHTAPGELQLGTGGMRRMLTALAQSPHGLTRNQIAVRAGMRQSGSFRNYMSALRQAGYIASNGEVNFATDAGVAALGDYEPLPTGRALFAYWCRELGSGEARLLQVIHEARAGVSREQIAEAAGMQQSGSFRNYMSKLNVLQLIRKLPGGLVEASEDLYDA